MVLIYLYLFLSHVCIIINGKEWTILRQGRYLPTRNLNAGSASGPKILILWKMGNVTP